MRKIIPLLALSLLLSSASYSNPIKSGEFTLADGSTVTITPKESFKDFIQSPKGILTATFLFMYVTPIIKKIISSIYLASNTMVGCVTIDGAIADTSNIVKTIEEFSKNPMIKAILVKINSPGGLSGAGETIALELDAAKKKKPIIALVESVCASAAYHIASSCDCIVAPKASVVGSIGTILPRVKFEETPSVVDYGNLGTAVLGKFSEDAVYAGRFKKTGTPFEELSDEERAYLQQYVNDSYETFCEHVAERRGLDLDKLHEWADARIFTGKQALELNMIDRNGALTEAKAVIAEQLDKRGIKMRGELLLIEPPKSSGMSFLKFLENPEERAKITADFISKIKESLKFNNEMSQLAAK